MKGRYTHIDGNIGIAAYSAAGVGYCRATAFGTSSAKTTCRTVSSRSTIAVEVVSPEDTAAEVDEKVQEYLDAGARRVWVVKPRVRAVTVHYPDGTTCTLRGNDILSGEEVFPGFKLRVADLFNLGK